jgi:hypothetical protein
MRKIARLGLGLGLLLVNPALALADTQIEIKQPTVFQSGIPTIGSLISGLVGLAIIIAALLAFVYLVWGGIEWITSGGDKAGMEAARSRITNAFIGLFIVAAAWAITKLIETFFGITIISGPISLPVGHP